ncbi:MAG: T9SS type A sorting domain-containing protein [Candidatus Cloacimonetes bacterium]|nr:T9SS type A sorting domain-containing protein [Candidatus Cloacimonadota bacterium]
MRYLICAFMLISAGLLSAVNNMPLLTTMAGEFPGAALGWSTCSIDFNGDGIKDLVALERHWNPDGVYNSSFGRYGRILFYWGGTDFDNEADASINGEYHRQYGSGWIQNVGDVNNDGFEDLCYWGGESGQNKICIFYGRQNPFASPDFTLLFPASEVQQIGNLYPMGDINNDGHADIGYVLISAAPHSPAKMRVLDGASLLVTDLYSVLWGGQSSSIRGIGDVNNDGIDDYHVQRTLSDTDNTHSWLSVHFGSNEFPSTDSLLISPDTNSLIVPLGCPLGDVNGDGIDDFASFINYEGVKVWFGSTDLTAQWDVALPVLSYGGYAWGVFVNGDFNNDGFGDIVTSDYIYGGRDGIAYLWMGGSQFNSTVDLVLYAPPGGVGEWYGYCMATGDFNNDGFCDLAISEPYCASGALWTSGKIHVYMGNAQLEDTTVDIDDPTAPAIDSAQWDYSIYPNPMAKDFAEINFDFYGEGYKELQELYLELFNIKGQKLFAGAIPANMIKDGKWSVNIGSLPTGVYLAKIIAGTKVINAKKFTLK